MLLIKSYRQYYCYKYKNYISGTYFRLKVILFDSDIFSLEGLERKNKCNKINVIWA